MSRVRGPRLWWRALLVLGVAAVLAGGTATVASAHDALVGTSPAAGSTVGAVPGQVTLTFDQPALALGTTVLVTGPGGPVTRHPHRTGRSASRVREAIDG